MKRYFSILFLAVFILTACQTEDTQTLPTTQPDMKGNIASLKRTNGKKSSAVAIVLVEAVEGIETNYPKASLRIDGNTYIEGIDGAILRLENLREGQLVEAWFEGQVMESFPIQAHASAIRVNY